MSETTHEHPPLKPWYRRELFFFIGGSIIVALVLVMVSLALYVSSGASLLDLSRPGYKSVQNELQQTDSFEAFSQDGSVDRSTLEQFQKLYQKQVKTVTNSSDFDDSSLSDSTLGIDDPTTSE